MLTGESARKTLPLCFASFCLAGFIILVIPPAPAPEIGYDVTALGPQPWFNPSRSYITARGVSEAVGRPVGNADMITCDDQQDMENNRRPVSYLADDGIIRQGMLKLDKNKPEWKITLTDSKGKPIPPAQRIESERNQNCPSPASTMGILWRPWQGTGREAALPSWKADTPSPMRLRCSCRPMTAPR